MLKNYKDFESEDDDDDSLFFPIERRQEGCFLCDDNIKDKKMYLSDLSLKKPFQLYYGNKCMEFLFCLFIILLFTVPFSV